MTSEELLYPRYKVINNWPDMGRDGYHVGKIVRLRTKEEDGRWCLKERDLTTYEAFFQNYPHLFEPLPWWKDRKVEEMSEYLKCLSPNFKWGKGDIIKVDRWLESFGPTLRFYSPDTDKITHHPCSFVPATEADYNAYMQTSNQNNG